MWAPPCPLTAAVLLGTGRGRGLRVSEPPVCGIQCMEGSHPNKRANEGVRAERALNRPAKWLQNLSLCSKLSSSSHT